MIEFPPFSTVPVSAKQMVTVTGRGEPALLFVHGFCCSKEDWDGILPALSSDHLCIALDLPGHGAATVPDDASIEVLATAVVAAKKASGAQRVILVGHSLGAKVIRDAYRLDPDGVVGMVMIDGVLYQGDGVELLAAARRRLCEDFDVFVEHQFGRMFPEGSDALIRNRVLDRARAMDPDFTRRLYIDAVAFDPSRGRDTLAALKTATLALQSTVTDGQGRRVSLIEGMRTPFMDAVETLVPGGRAIVIPGAGHFTMFDSPNRVIDEIRRFAASFVPS